MELDVTAMPLEEKSLRRYCPPSQRCTRTLRSWWMKTSQQSVRATVEEGAGELIESVELFDIFRGEQLGAGKKSLAFQLLFRAADRTLTDEEVNEHRTAAAELAKQRLGAEMRWLARARKGR